jgi:hypothetical protein
VPSKALRFAQMTGIEQADRKISTLHVRLGLGAPSTFQTREVRFVRKSKWNWSHRLAFVFNSFHCESAFKPEHCRDYRKHLNDHSSFVKHVGSRLDADKSLEVPRIRQAIQRVNAKNRMGFKLDTDPQNLGYCLLANAPESLQLATARLILDQSKKIRIQ